MAKKLIRYLLEGNGSVPAFVEDGGYCPLGEELVGRSVDDSIRHIPSTVAVMTRADLIARITQIGPVDIEGNPMDPEVMADTLLEHLGLSNLA